MSDSIKALGTKPIGTLLRDYSLPAIAGMTLVSLYNIIDSIFIGHGVGALGISGVAVTFPLLNLVLAVCLMVAIGGATVCSIELGRKNQRNASMVLGQVLILSLVFGISLTVVGLLTLEPVLRLFGASDATLPYAADFMRIMYYGTPTFCVMLSFSHLTRASGYPLRSLLMSAFSVGVNIILAPLFIFGFGWGMRGAALASVLAQLAALAGFLIHFSRKSSNVRFQRGIFRLRPEVAKPMLYIGLSPFLMNACACLVIIAVNISLYAYGGDLAIGAYGVINRLLMLTVMILVGLTQGMQPILGYNFGAGNADRVRETLRYAIIISTVVCIVSFIGAELFPGFLAGLFTDDAELLAISVTGLRIGAATFMLVGAQIIITAYFQSVGLASTSIFLSLARQLIFLIPGILLFPLLIGLNGIWLSLPVSDTLSFIVTMFIFYRHTRSGRMELSPKK